LLTGYVGDKTFLNKLADFIEELKVSNPNLVYLCDPVLGDDGKLYVAKELVDIYLKRILPQANIITPNLFELELEEKHFKPVFFLTLIYFKIKIKVNSWKVN
jgi:pyridoxine kinase